MSTKKIVDQPAPLPNGRTPVWQLVMQDMQARDETGTARYGTPLQAFNGRDALVDAYQEGLDMVVYLRQIIEERDALPPPAPVNESPLRPFEPTSFTGRFAVASKRAAAIVLSRDDEGRNAATSPREQFASISAVLDMIYMKLQRARSYMAAGNLAKFIEETDDMANYSLFAGIFLTEEHEVALAAKINNTMERLGYPQITTSSTSEED